MIAGGTGRGKSSYIAIPTLATWPYSIFAIDLKGELTRNHKKLSEIRRPTKVLTFSRGMSGYSYDPFYFLKQDGAANLSQNVRELAQAIIPVPINTRQPFWPQSAQNILAGFLLFYYCTNVSFNSAITRIQQTPISELIGTVNSSTNGAAKNFIGQFSGFENIDESEMVFNVSATLKNQTMVFATDSTLRRVFTPTENIVRWEDLETNNIFVRIDMDKLDQWGNAVALLLSQLLRTLERRPEKHSPEGKKQKPILLLLDEFPRLGKLDMIENALSTLRSKGITICIMVQSLAQLDKTYGEDTRRTILENCDYKAILGASDVGGQKYFSDMAGDNIVERKSSSINYSENGIDILGYSKQLSGVWEPIRRPHEFATMEDIMLVTPDGTYFINGTSYYKNEF